MNTRIHTRRPARARKIILVILALILLVIIAVPFVALPIVSAVAKGYAEDAASNAFGADATIDKVALSWSGPQRVSGLRFTDPQTGDTYNINATTSTPIKGLISNPTNLSLSWDATVDRTNPAPATPAKQKSSKSKPSTPGASEPFKLPSEFNLDLVIEPSSLTVIEPDPADPARSVELKWTDIEGAAKLTDAANLRAWLSAKGPTDKELVDIDLRSNNLFSATGQLQHRAAETDIAVDINIAHPTFEALRPLLGINPEIVAGKDGFRSQGKWRDKDGVITITDPGHPPFVSFSLSADFMRSLSPDLGARPYAVTVALPELILPITEDPNNPIDLANAAFKCSVFTKPIEIPLRLEPGAPPRTLRLSQLELIIQTERLSRGIGLYAQGSTAADDLKAGALSARATISNLFDDAGNLDPSDPIFFAEAELEAVPSQLIAPFIDKYGLDFAAGFGHLVNLKARIEPEIDDSLSPPAPTDALVALINLNAENGPAAAGLRYEPGVSITQWQTPINAQCFNAVALARPLIEQHGLDITGDGSVMVQLSEFNIPLAPDNTPNLEAATGILRFMVGDAFVRTAPGIEPINAELIDFQLTIDANKPPHLAMESRLIHQGSTVTPSARFDLHGYSTSDPANFDSLEPVGTLTAPDVPIDLLRLVSQDLADQARDLLGPTISATLTAPPTPTTNSTQRTDKLASLECTAQNLTANALLAVENNKPSVSDLRASLTVAPETARALLAKSGNEPPLHLAEQTTLNFNLNDFAMGPSGSPLAPGAFRLDADVSIPTLALAIPGDTSGSGRLDLQDVSANIKSAPGPALDLAINANHAVAALDPFTANAKITNIASAAGALTTVSATINATAKGDLPTPFIDASASSPGTFTALLGPTTKVDLTAKDLTPGAGSLTAKLDSPNSDAEVAGHIQDGAFVADSITTANLTRFTPEASKQIFASAFPLFSNVEKTTEDDPAALSIENLVVPIDGDIKKLSGVGTFDPGVIRFETSNILAKILESTSNNAVGSVGRKVEPINFTMDKGVIRYQEFTLPAGEFDIVTQGKVNLASKKLDVLLSVPLYALSSEIAASLGQIPGLDRLTSVPIRISGETANPKIDVDTKLFLERIPESILGGLGDLGGGLGGGVEKGAQGAGGLLDGIFKQIENEITGDKDDKKDEEKDAEGGDKDGDKKKKNKKNKDKKKKKNKKKKDKKDNG